MEKVNFCKTALIALLLLGAVASSPLLEAEEAIIVPTIQFLSKTTDEHVCTAYQVRGQLFVTAARCLGEDHSAINQLTALDIVGQGPHKIQAFAIRGSESEASEDIAVVMYDGPLEKSSNWAMPELGGFVAAFSLYPMERFEREGDAGEASAAAAIGLNLRLIVSVMALFGSMMLVK